VAVQGIEGTLSNFDVRVTMEKQGKAFAKCHEARARKVPALAGAIEFRVHVLRSGEVSDVQVRASDLGDRVLERCMSEVIAAATFPAPHGGEADVSWNMSLERSRGRAPEQWEAERVEKVLRKNQSGLLEACDVRRGGPITVTAYVSPRGKVLSAGVSATKSSTQEQFDCIADELRSWPMPRPRKGVAKVSFPLRSGA
jgi:outer membrane biosynthesis protein TonB